MKSQNPSSCLTNQTAPPTCVGKVTYLSASYWHHELSIFDTAGKEYSYANAFDLYHISTVTWQRGKGGGEGALTPNTSVF